MNSKEEIMEEICRVVREGEKAVFAYVNVYAYNLAADLPWFKEFMQHADVVVADGQGIRLASRILGKPVPAHLPLSGWIWEIIRMCQEQNFSIFLLGGESEVIDAAAGNLLQRFPGLKLRGKHHGYFENRESGSEEVVRMINAASPDLLIIGFGMPLQEKWIADNIHRLNVHGIFTVGGCFDVIAGKRWHVPRVIRQVGLEWAWRLMQEPGRLYRRYLFGNPKFIWRIVREAVKH